jgi:hypothetical protein
METNQELVNWNEEADKLKQQAEFERFDWWKAVTGQHKIKILSDGKKYEFVDKDTEKTVKKVRFDIEVKQQKFSWGVTEGMTQDSLFGQLVLLAVAKKGLAGQEINLVVKGTGKQKRYTILEALSLTTSVTEAGA